jgi:Rrf2 family protein
MQISKKTQYGLRAMIFLARKFKDKKDYSLKEISKSEGVSFDFLEKILSELEKKGLVKSKKGAYGGYRLARNPSSINAGQIVEVLEKTTTPVDCFLCGRAKKCASKNVWKKIETNINKTLKGIKLSDLI